MARRNRTTYVPLTILRCIFLVLAIALSVHLFRTVPARPDMAAWWPWFAVIVTPLLAVTVIAVDIFVPHKRWDIVSAVYFGTVVGIFLTYVVDLALSPLLTSSTKDPSPVRTGVQLLVGMMLCYTCISLLLQTKDDFRFIIPYVEFAKQVKGLRPYVLDTSVIIDGRIADVMESHMIDNQLIMPRFVLGELQAIADSSDRLKRSRGRRGLDILNRMRGNSAIELTIDDVDLPEFRGQPVDLKVVLLAKSLEGKVITNDYNLNKVAKLHGVEVINLNDLSNALKPVVLPGEQMAVKIVKSGEEAGQGVGYLDDGTMVVVEGGREHQNSTVRVVVTSVLQTSAGRMIFGKFDSKL